MKLKNLMNTNALKNGPRKVKPAKFAELGINLLNNKRKHSYFKAAKHQNSEYIEITENMTSVNNKGNSDLFK